MANTKKTATAKTTEPEAQTVDAAVDTQPSKPAASAPKAKKRLASPADDVRIKVRSNQYGRMGFINSRNGERTYWYGINDTQEMRVGDLRDMKSNAPRFLQETWVVVEEIEDPAYENLSIDEIYDVLGISKFAATGRPRYLSDILEWDRFEIGANVEKMSRNTKENVAIALNTEIQRGHMTDLMVIRAWQDALGMQLDTDLSSIEDVG